MEIREYKEEDEKEVIALWSLCDLVVPWNDPKKDIERKLKVDRDLFLIIKEPEMIIGTVMGGYEGHRGWINYLTVHPQHQRKGVGTLLMKEVEKRIKSKGCPKINLQVRESNTEVLSFYKAIGYGNDNVVSLGKRLVQDS